MVGLKLLLIHDDMVFSGRERPLWRVPCSIKHSAAETPFARPAALFAEWNWPFEKLVLLDRADLCPKRIEPQTSIIENTHETTRPS